MIATPAGLPKVGGNRALRVPASALASLALIASLGAQAQGSGPLDIYSEDSLPRREPAATAFPNYPDDARRDRREGETTVCFRIDARGEIIRPKVRSSTHRAFEKPAMVAIRASMFTPLEAGEPESAAEVCRVYRFKLNPIAAPATGADPLVPIEQRDPETAGTLADAPAETDRPETLVVTATKTEPDAAGGRVCKDRRRPGSMIATTICYSREEQLAFDQAKERTLSDLEREQLWRDQVINDAKMKNEWPRGGGLGPNH